MSLATVTIKRDPGIDEQLELLRGRRSMATIARFLIAGVEHGNEILQGFIVKERLTGDGPFPVKMKRLGVVTGTLRRRLRFSRPTFAGGRLKTSVGSAVKYWRRHEFGGSGRMEKVKSAGVKAAKVKGYNVPNAFGKGKTVKVESHTRKAYMRKAYMRKDTMPKREPVQAGIREHGQRVYSQTIEKALARALRGGLS